MSGTDIVKRDDLTPERITTGVLCYDSNNSGGYWWLEDEDWEALEGAGWSVHWVQARGGGRDYENPLGGGARTGNRWLGAAACFAAKRFADAVEGITEWVTITGQDPSAEGCNCCGAPHSFEWRGDDGTTKYATSIVTQTALEWS